MRFKTCEVSVYRIVSDRFRIEATSSLSRRPDSVTAQLVTGAATALLGTVQVGAILLYENQWCAPSVKRSSQRWFARSLACFCSRPSLFASLTLRRLQVIVPDKWKEGASNVTEGGGRKVNENKLLSKKQRYANSRPSKAKSNLVLGHAIND